MDKFTPKRLLGRSNFEVWEATNNLTGRTVALKYVPYRSDDEVPALLEEVKKQVALRHAKIVEVYGADVDKDNQRVLIEMELADAGSLESRLGNGKRLPVEEALRIITDVLEALEHAHNNRVVHFDIKPANILLFKDGTAKLADFGIAKTLGTKGITSKAGGTDDFLGPEYYDGSEQFGPRTDIWAFGVVLYIAVTGNKPFISPEQILKCKFLPVSMEKGIISDNNLMVINIILKRIFQKHEQRNIEIFELLSLLKKIAPAENVVVRTNGKTRKKQPEFEFLAQKRRGIRLFTFFAYFAYISYLLLKFYDGFMVLMVNTRHDFQYGIFLNVKNIFFYDFISVLYAILCMIIYEKICHDSQGVCQRMIENRVLQRGFTLSELLLVCITPLICLPLNRMMYSNVITLNIIFLILLFLYVILHIISALCLFLGDIGIHNVCLDGYFDENGNIVLYDNCDVPNVNGLYKLVIYGEQIPKGIAINALIFEIDSSIQAINFTDDRLIAQRLAGIVLPHGAIRFEKIDPHSHSEV